MAEEVSVVENEREIEDQQNNADELTICPICIEVFKSPKYLPCLHTFCQSCLCIFIKSAVNSDPSVLSTGFNCPVCWTFVPSPGSVTSPEDWANQLPGNHLINTLMDKRNLPKSAQPPVVNDVINTNNNNTQDKGGDIKGRRVSRKLPKQPGTEPTLELFCKEHKDKRLDLFCGDHEEPCCISCLTANHKTCYSVLTLEEAAKGIAKKQTTLDLLNRLKDINQLVENILEDKKANINDLEKQKEWIEKEVDQLKEDITVHLDKLVSKLRDDISLLHKKQMEDLKSQLERCEKRHRVVTNCQKVFDACLKHASDIHMFIEINKLKSILNEQEEYLSINQSEFNRIDYEFEIFQGNLKDCLQSLGSVKINTAPSVRTVEIKNAPIRSTASVSLKNCVPHEVKTLSLKIGKNNTIVRGGIFFPDGRLLLADHANSRLCLFDEQFEMEMELQVPGNPWDLSLMGHKKAAFTIPNKSCSLIQILDLESMKIEKELRFPGKLYGLTYVDGYFVVTTDTEFTFYHHGKSSVLVLDQEGNIVRTLSQGKVVQHVRAVSKDRIYYTNWESNTVHCMTLEGEELFHFTHGDLCRPRGLTLDREGNIYVCGLWSNSVFQFSPDGEYLRTILDKRDGTLSPEAIGFDINSNRFFVSRNQSVIKIYRMKKT